ncbi:antibiotic biosynthesis monooxygenase [Hyalangium versicolor]|uniref:antibiotic biosynthesis monooxygenase n=1 Tax=Hyalangium versicolor TaxID=2861190 RepID=UPI001CC92886|nr:antibiotic biosynthesis monooxygenase [Hyalangium versicolor]
MDATKTIDAGQPVKIVLERRVKPGAKEPFEQWIKEVMAVATGSLALQGSSVLTAGEHDYFILLRFASQADLDRWHTSPEVVELLRKGEALATAPDQPLVRSGLETWFTIPGHPAPRVAPPKWKMALVTWCALLPQVILLGFIVPKGLPFPLGVALSTAIPVAMLTWVIMPRLTKLLYGWLYAPDRRLAS